MVHVVLIFELVIKTWLKTTEEKLNSQNCYTKFKYLKGTCTKYFKPKD